MESAIENPIQQLIQVTYYVNDLIINALRLPPHAQLEMEAKLVKENQQICKLLNFEHGLNLPQYPLHSEYAQNDSSQ